MRIRRLLIHSAAIAVLFSVVFTAISYAWAGRIANPIVKLTKNALEVVDKNFNFTEISTQPIEQVSQTSKDEIGKLAKTFKNLITELQVYIVNLRETTAAKERIESELKIAHDIQMGLLPRTFPEAPAVPQLSMHGIVEPAKEVGGDLYDSFAIDSERVFFGVGDVSDKGMSAALFMAVTKALFRAYGQEGLPLGEVLQTVNNELCRDNDSQMFVTVFFCVINVTTGEIEYCDGGHENPFILYKDGAVELLKKRGGTALGFMPDMPYDSGTIRLQPGDTIFLYTDGVNEAMNTERRQFSVPYLEECLKKLTRTAPKEITQTIVKKVHEHAGEAPQSDDITVFAVQYLG
jgi:sigma-B regulation protein RsbU (phosphoserine phosphatase)